RTSRADNAVRVDEINRATAMRGRSALCLSGGGIRSASFSVGVLQGLARHGLIQKFDYLSTVSGGGFAGGWLSAWLHRATETPPSHVASAVAGAEAARDGWTFLTTGVAGSPPVEPWPVTQLRRYTRYMSPQAGSLSADTWALVATMVRNLLLNWAVLI